jgi:hypothetical protein
MHAAFHIFINRRRSVAIVRFSDSRNLNLKRCGSRRRKTARLLGFTVRRSCPIDRIRSKHSVRRSLRSDLIRKVRWRSPRWRLYVADRASFQRYWLWRYRRLALLVAHATHSSSSSVGLISWASVIWSIVSVIFFAIPQSFAQDISASQAPLLTDKQAFQQIEDRWSEALNKQDQYGLELVLSPELIDISATGTLTTRNQQIARLLQKPTESPLLDQRVVNVRSFGEIAVVIGNYVEQPSAKDKMLWRSGMFTHIYRRVLGRWSCISAQRTAIADRRRRKRGGRRNRKKASQNIARSG